MAKNAKLNIYHTRSTQAKIKYCILLLQHRLKKLLYIQIWQRIMQMSILLIPEGRYSEDTHKIKRQNLKLGQCTMEKYCKVFFRIYCSSANFTTACCLRYAQSPVKHLQKAPPQMPQ